MILDLIKFGYGSNTHDPQRQGSLGGWRKIISVAAKFPSERSKTYFDVELREEYRTFLESSLGTPQWRHDSSVSLGILPLKWAISSDHTWYDGEYCRYQIGPFVVYISGYFTDCEKGRL